MSDSINWPNLCVYLFDLTSSSTDIAICHFDKLKGRRSSDQTQREVFYNFNTQLMEDIDWCLSILERIHVSINVFIYRNEKLLCQRLCSRPSENIRYDF